jgi:hypothetical protein
MKTKQVRDLQDEKYTLVQDSQEIKAVMESIGYKYPLFGGLPSCLLVEVLDGEYGEVWEIDGFTPFLTETAYQINS